MSNQKKTGGIVLVVIGVLMTLGAIGQMMDSGTVGLPILGVVAIFWGIREIKRSK